MNYIPAPDFPTGTVEVGKEIDGVFIEVFEHFRGKLRKSRFRITHCGGADGIAVGMATNIPPHNLAEVIDGTIAMIDNQAS